MGIRLLPAEVVDQIAAGEVLERPANLVKELIENSLDAGATEIEVDFDQGGRSIRIVDNGRGMSANDLPLALQRHATSKIQAADDLYRLQSFGFRGEALASIAAVSRVRLISRRLGDESAWRLDCEFGQVGEAFAVSAPVGTDIQVEELFANIPARLSFLKSESAEHTQIRNTLKALALAHENVSFRVRSKNELIFHWPATADLRERAQMILEKSELFYGQGELEGLRAEVLVSAPQDTQNVNRNLWFFVQNRWIQDRSLSAAVMEGYRNLLMHGEYPTVVVKLQIPFGDVDVNIHPTKSQVKFRNSQNVFRVVSRTIRQVLEKAPWLPENVPSTAIESTPGLFEKEETSFNLSFNAPELERVQYLGKVFPLQEVCQAVQESMTIEPKEPSNTQTTFRWADLQVIGQAHLTYIVAQSQDSFYMVDQHAAHERVVFERLMHGILNGKMDVQNLLLPLVVDLSSDEIEALMKAQAQVQRLGLNVEPMGPQSVAVQSIPSLIQETAVAEALRKLAMELSRDGGSSALERSMADVVATMACHSVVRAGQALSVEQMQSLLQQMDDFPLSSFCPHGRPVYVRRRFYDIEREFGRIV